MRSLLKLNLKIIFLSPIIYLYYAFILFFYLFFICFIEISNSSINYAFSLDLLAYLEISVFILSFCIAVYFIQQKHLLEDLCHIPKTRIVLMKMAAAFLSCLPICFLPVVYIFLNELIAKTSFFFMIMALVYFLTRWISIIVVSQLFGGTLGLYIPYKTVYLIAAPLSVLFSHLNLPLLSRITDYKTGIKLSNLLSVQKPYINSVEIDYAAPRIDLQFILKAIIVIFLSALIISILNTTLDKKIYLHNTISIAVSALLLATASVFYLSNAPKPYDYFDKIYFREDNVQDIIVQAYTGKMKLSEYSYFDCHVKIKKNYSGNSISFRLDNCFKINDINYDGRKIEYSRNKDFIILSDESLANKGVYTINFSYGGRVQYVSDTDCINIYTSFFSSALPPNFAFIPVPEGNTSDIDYAFTVECANKLISNLSVQQAGTNQYLVNGTSKSICLFSGFLDHIVYDDIIIYKSAYNFSTDYISVYRDSISRKFYDPKENTYVEKAYMKPKKVFMIYYLYGVVGFPVEYDDYIMINYGFPF